MPKTSPVSGQPVSRGWRFPLSPRIILALARQTFQYSVRRKVLLVLVIFALFLWVSFTVAPKSFPEKRVELVIQATLILTSFFGVIVVVFLSSTTIPADLNDRTIYTVLTKPVGRLNYLVGRIVGFVFVGVVLLVIMGAIGWGFIRITAHWAGSQLPGQELLQARRNAVPERIHMREAPDGPDLPPEVFENTGKIGLWQHSWSTALLFDFSGPELAGRQGRDVTVSFQPEILTGAKLPRAQVLIRAVNPRTGFSKEVRTTLDSRRLAEISCGPEVVDPQLGMQLQLQRLTGAYVLFAPNEVAVVLSPAPFEYPLAKSLLMILCSFILLIVIGVMGSSYLSRWVAVVLTFFAYFIGVFSEILADVAHKLSGAAGSQGLLGTDWGVQVAPHEHGPSVVTQPNAMVDFLNHVFSWLLRAVIVIIPDFRHFDGSSLLIGGYDIPFSVWGGAVFYAAVYGVIYLVIAQLLWRWREVG